MYAATSGEIVVAGEPVSIMSPHDAQSASIRLCINMATWLRHYSVRETFSLGSSPHSNGSGRRLENGSVWATALLERVNMPIDPRTPVQALRPDQVAMVSIAKALATDAKASFPMNLSRLWSRWRSGYCLIKCVTWSPKVAHFST